MSPAIAEKAAKGARYNARVLAMQALAQQLCGDPDFQRRNEEAEEAIRRGETISLDELRRKFG